MRFDFGNCGIGFALPEIRAGTLADAATIKLPKRIPYHVAMDLLLTGRWMGCAEGHKWGLVNEVFDDANGLYTSVGVGQTS